MGDGHGGSLGNNLESDTERIYEMEYEMIGPAKRFKLTVSITTTENEASHLKDFCRSMIDPFWPSRFVTYAKGDHTEKFYIFDFFSNDKETLLEAIEDCKNDFPKAQFALSESIE